jgi:hypothetical protein
MPVSIHPSVDNGVKPGSGKDAVELIAACIGTGLINDVGNCGAVHCLTRPGDPEIQVRSEKGKDGYACVLTHKCREGKAYEYRWELRIDEKGEVAAIRCNGK